eukprot:TRINITY_DN110940_c0_g1_i1.p1 TRINITY_DN110940_c0_g1~~TRINITY_DN110940_c0_g1_i1.p1  ORF type:complete len:861 (-),score=203.49 TRINITY_DN110940_c0_g1_i1:116-2698(-)
MVAVRGGTKPGAKSAPRIVRSINKAGKPGAAPAAKPAGAVSKPAGKPVAQSSARPLSARLDSFISGSSLDDRALKELRQAHPAHQEFVLEKGVLSNARNPSALVLSRLRDAERALPQHTAQRQDGDGAATADDVESYIQEHIFDDTAADALREAHGDTQSIVLRRGTLMIADDQSSALLARVADAELERQSRELALGTESDGAQHGHEDTGFEAKPQKTESFAAVPRPSLRAGISQKMEVEEDSLAAEPAASAGTDTDELLASVHRGEFTMEDAVYQFLADCAVDDSASESLLTADPERQRFVIQRGNLASCKNPSAMIMARLKEAKAEAPRRDAGHDGHAGGGPAGDMQDERMAEQVQQLIDMWAIDERAAGQLKSAPLDVQAIVLDRGGFEDARNPSAALIGRLKEAYADLESHSDALGVEAFIAENQLDERAGEAMRTAAPELQRAVIERGSLSRCSNPSSALIGRLRDAEPQVQVQAVLDNFIGQNQLDERATAALLESPPEVQFAVIERGSLTTTKNPSAVLLSRIKQAMQDYAAYGGKGFAGFEDRGGKGMSKGPSKAARGGGDEVEVFIRQWRIDEKAARELRDAPTAVQIMVLERGGFQDVRNPSASLAGRLRAAFADLDGHGRGQGGAHVLEAFISANGLDERAAEAIRNSLPEVQQAIVEQGNLTDCHNPSSKMMMRLRDTEAMFAGSMTVDTFLAQNPVDDRAATAFLEADYEVQMDVMERGSLATTQNPSAALLMRVRNAEKERGIGSKGGGKGEAKGKGKGMPFPTPVLKTVGKPRPAAARGGQQDIETMIDQFVRRERLDAKAADALRTCSPQVVMHILDRGTLQTARNPSAALLGRIREAESGSR